MSKIKFDKPDSESPFLTFVSNEFKRRGTPRRKELANKQNAATEVARLGLRVPRKFKFYEDIEQFKSWHVKKRAVLKYARGWSSRGVMLLEREGLNEYFDHMALRKHNLNSIKRDQVRVADSFESNEPQWILEEFLEASQSLGAVPYDYKFYVFGGQIGLVVQADRNTSPPKFALFDGAFKPLQLGKDYLLTSENCQPGVPILPPHAIELMWWALKLASITDAPFVSIDLYDTPDGPVFGEFTFSPGGTHKRMFSFSQELIEYFDQLFIEAEKNLEAGSMPKRGRFDNTSARFVDLVADADYKTLVRTSRIPMKLYKSLSGIAYNHGSRGALRLSEYYEQCASTSKDEIEAAIFRHLAKSWKACRTNIKSLTEKLKLLASTQ